MSYSTCKEVGLDSIDLFVGTHPHADHIGQAWRVFQAYEVTDAWLSGDTESSVTIERTLDAIEAEGASYHELRAGEVVNIGSAHTEIVCPAHLGYEDITDGSVAFRLIFGNIAFMFTGDAEAVAEEEMLGSGRYLQAQILKVSHHASISSSTIEFFWRRSIPMSPSGPRVRSIPTVILVPTRWHGLRPKILRCMVRLPRGLLSSAPMGKPTIWARAMRRKLIFIL